MQINEFFIIFPEGDVQEVQGRLPFNSLVDMNGNVLNPPLPTNKMLVFKVSGIKSKQETGVNETYHFLKMLSAQELLEYV